jgi:hypothetical protein
MTENTVTQPGDSVQYKFDSQAGSKQKFVQSDIGVFGGRVLFPGDQVAIATSETVDVFCMVKSGSAQILDSDGVVLADLGTQDGIVLPSGTGYSIRVPEGSATNAEVLEFHASHVPLVESYQPFSG